MPVLESDWQLFASSRPATVASAASIAPSSGLTVLTGNVGVATIVPPLPNQVHVLYLQFAGTAGVVATGNILTAKASVVGEVMALVYNPNTAKYVPVG